MITEYQIANFKAFGSPQTLPIRPITLIFGPNSSGKSSIFQSLLMLKQTLEQPEDQILSVKGNLVDLGSYREFINRHNFNNKFEFKMLVKPNWDTQQEEWIDDGLEKKLINQLEIIDTKYKGIVGLRIVFNFEDNFYISIEKIELYIGDNPAPIIIYQPYKLGEKNPKMIAYLNPKFREQLSELESSDFLFNSTSRNNFNIDNLTISKIELASKQNNKFDKIYMRLYNYLLNIRINDYYYHQLMDDEDLVENNYTETIYSMITILTSLSIRESLNETIYIGPFREFPEKYFSLRGIKANNVGKSGKFFADILAMDDNILKKVNYWFSRFDVRYELKVPWLLDPDTNIQDVYSLRLFDKNTGVHVVLTDVGFGRQPGLAGDRPKRRLPGKNHPHRTAGISSSPPPAGGVGGYVH